MSAPLENFDRVNEFIQEVYQNVEDNRHLYQFLCSDSHKLLQPWPAIEEHQGQEEIGRNEQNGSGRSSAGSDKCEPNLQEDGQRLLSQEEANALADVEDILSKAQKARKQQAKISKSTTRKTRTHHISSSSSSHNRKQNLPQSIPTTSTDLGTNDQIESESSTNEQETPQDSDTAVISASKLQHLLSHTTKPSTHNASKSRNTNSVPIKLPPIKSKKASVKVPRPTSASKMQYRTSSSEIGNHGSRTRKPPSGLSLQRQKAKTEQKSNLQKTKSLSRSSERLISGAKRHPLVRSQSEESRSNGRTINSPSVESMSWSSDDRESGVADLVDETDCMVLTGSASSCRTEEETLMETPPFMLTKDGSSLKVPVKLKKLHSSARKLREKLDTTSYESDTMESHFRTRLESKFSSDSSLMSHRDLEDKLEHLHAECSQLCHVAKELQQVVTSITGTCTWQEIYRTKALLETITSRYNELQQEIAQLKKVEKTLVSKCHHKPSLATPSMKKHRRNLSLPLATSTPWLQTACRNMSPMSDGAGASSGCSSMFLSSAGSSSASVMQYNKVKDKKRLVTLQYQAQYVMWQMDIEKLIAEDILPILQNMDPADPEFIPLYRTVYGLLCHSGEAYPSLIKDNIGNSDDEEEHG